MKTEKDDNKRMRKFKRTEIELEVKYQPIIIQNQNWYTTVTTGIGTGGICMISMEYLGIGTIIRIQLPLTNLKKLFVIKGKVSCSSFLPGKNLYEAGINFIELNSDEKRMISKYIDDYVHL